MRTYSLPCRAANQWPRRQSLTTTEEAVAAESRVAPRSFCRVVKEGLETFWRWDSLPCTVGTHVRVRKEALKEWAKGGGSCRDASHEAGCRGSGRPLTPCTYR